MTAGLATGRILSNQRIAAGIHQMTLDCPAVAAEVLPGQFVHLGIPGLEAHLLRRPLSVYDTDGDAGTVAFVYAIVGAGTEQLAMLPAGEQLSLLGPLGRGWRVPLDCSKALLVAGGVGIAPLFMLAGQLAKQGIGTHLVLGAQSADKLVCSSDWGDDLGIEQLHIATDDGSVGYHGFCTDIAAQLLAQDGFGYIATCGPELMQRIVAKLAAEHSVPCEVSLERRMACGIGACLSCTVDTTSGRQRACKDGPVFDAREVIW
jgi:dihydroorotate dehydrogenase electron transfer subunit